MTFCSALPARIPSSRLSLLAASLICLFSTGTALAGDPEVEALKEMVKALQQEVAAIKLAQAKMAETVSSAAPVAAASTSLPLAAPAGFGPGLKVYGALDSGVEWISHVGNAHNGLSRIPATTGSGPSRLGIEFEHEVRPGVKAIARAEMGLTLDNGSSGQGGRLFGRQVYVGVDSAYGSLTVGRQYSMLFYSLLDADILGPNIFSLGSVDAYVPNARADNALVWRGKFAGWSLGASYSFGRETIANTVPASGSCAGEESGSTKCRAWSGLVKYDAASFGGAVALDQQAGGSGATASFFNGAAPLAFAASGDRDTRLTVNGYARFGELKLGVGVLNRSVKTDTARVRQDTTWIQAAYPWSTSLMLDGGVFHVSNDDQQRSANLYVLRGVYSFDPQLAAYVSLGHIDNSAQAAYGLSAGGAGAAPAAGMAQDGVMTGLRYRF